MLPGPRRQAGHQHQLVPHCLDFSSSHSFYSTRTTLLPFTSYFSTMDFLIIMAPTHLVPQGLWMSSASLDCEDSGLWVSFICLGRVAPGRPVIGLLVEAVICAACTFLSFPDHWVISLLVLLYRISQFTQQACHHSKEVDLKFQCVGAGEMA